MNFNQKQDPALNLNKFIDSKISNNNILFGQTLPCTVVSVGVNGSSNTIVTVNIDVNQQGFTIPEISCPVAESKYIRLPVQIGDKGIILSASTNIGNVSGLGAGTPNLSISDIPGNLSACVFVPVANAKWPTVDPNTVYILAPNSGTIILDCESVVATHNMSATDAFTGTFTTATGQTVQVTGGLITNMY